MAKLLSLEAGKDGGTADADTPALGQTLDLTERTILIGLPSFGQ